MLQLAVIGSFISPYVRKVLVCLESKGLDYEIDPIAPFLGNAAFARLSPLRRIPVLLDGDLVLNDSSVICQYLEDRYSTPGLYPRNTGDRARARWLEEYADTRLADGLIWRLFYELSIKRRTTGQAADAAVVRQAREVEIPAALDYLETQMPATGFIFGEVSIADISLACYFRTAAFVGYALDEARWPRVAAVLAHTLALPAFRKLARYEDLMLKVPLAEQRQVLAAAGVRLTATTFGSGPLRPVVARTT